MIRLRRYSISFGSVLVLVFLTVALAGCGGSDRTPRQTVVDWYAAARAKHCKTEVALTYYHGPEAKQEKKEELSGCKSIDAEGIAELTPRKVGKEYRPTEDTDVAIGKALNKQDGVEKVTQLDVDEGGKNGGHNTIYLVKVDGEWLLASNGTTSAAQQQ